MGELRKADISEYPDLTPLAEAVPLGRQYPLSMTEGNQTGDIFTDGRGVLFWHYCGFAFMAGEYDSAFAEEVCRLMKTDNRRLLLFADEEQAALFGGYEGLVTERRLFFEYPLDKPVPQYPLPEGFEMSLLMPRLIPQLTGRIVPAFSWEEDRQFLDKGVGFCVTYGGRPCAWAFTAAVGGHEAYIGVECAEDFRRKGLAAAAAAMTAACVKEHGRKPVWACHEGNKASAGLAEKLGFVKTGECFVLHKA
ncbi:GNAT family N-acetyltransferase [Ruminococcus sp.]|uniref:GNAT family N-acetyltransferase n=1 Tax=Ruminococcus sp. TaxID=41978 RepID=UPI0025F2DCAE|nr:GNAT family N-acetyltransferase [Ruminococcus sp.]MBQ8967035.1 GNAT family N-acetyltransferase [Ruminococcus sp.]